MNTSNARLALSVQIIAFCLLTLVVPPGAESSPNGSASPVQSETKHKLGKLQIPFIANQGQSNKEVKFYARTFAGTVSVTENGQLLYWLPKMEGMKTLKAIALQEQLLGGKATEVKGQSQAITKLSYFKGNDKSNWRSNIPTYNRVSLGEVYEGVEVDLKAYGYNVEKLFYISPGTEPEVIRVKISGGKELRVNDAGELEVETENGTVSFSRPVAFQGYGEEKRFVTVAYTVWGNEYGFSVGEYDRTKELVIDPVLAATFVGGCCLDFANALAIDSAGNVYIAGLTGSSDLPGVGPGSADNTFAGGDVFVAKLNSDLSSVLAATFLGSSGFDEVRALGLDRTGNVYVTGFSGLPDFSGIGPGSADNTFAGGEVFVAKLDSDLSRLLAASFLGGSDSETAAVLAVDNNGNVYVAGVTDSSDFPGVGPGSADSTFEGSFQGFVAKLNSDLSSILAVTFLGGSIGATIHALALDSSGNVYAAGGTLSSDFPGVGPGSADSTFIGAEAYVAKLNSDLSFIGAATFLGGSGSIDGIRGLALDGIGNVYVGGVTDSADFPGIGPGSADSIIEKPFDIEGFIAKLDSDLTAILAATYLGGSTPDDINALALDSMGHVYVAGETRSPDFPGVTPRSADSTFGGSFEGFVAKLDSDLTAVLAATYLGGSNQDPINAIGLDSMGDVYVAGETRSPDFPGISPRSADSTLVIQESFVAKLDANLSRGTGGLEVVNNLVSLARLVTSFDPTRVPNGPAGTFTVRGTFTNISSTPILNPVFQVVELSNLLLNGDGGPGGVTLTPNVGAGGVLSPTESVTIDFVIGLVTRNRFTFFVNLLGVPSL